MFYKFEEGKDVIVDAVVEHLKDRMSGDQLHLCTEFARQFLGTVALNDLDEWEIEDLYGAVINFWSLIQQRSPLETKVRIYNPDFEKHCWQTTHTVIEVIIDEMPFLVDSLRMLLNRLGLVSHLVIHTGGLWVERNKKHEVTKVLPTGSKPGKSVFVESPILIEIDRQTDPAVLENLHKNIERVLKDNRAVVEDWQLMREKVREAMKTLEKTPVGVDPAEAAESREFLIWIENHHFTFLGVRDYDLIEKGDETILQPLPETGLGVLRADLSKSTALSISAMPPEARDLTLSNRAMVMFKTNTLATINRNAYTDYIGIKKFDKHGKVIGERRIIGLYTSAAYNTNPGHIPFLRQKVAQILKNSHFNPRGHAGRVLLNILETMPRDDLIQASEDELLEIAMGIYHMQERRRIRMFARTDVYRRFVSCLVYIPKEHFNTELRQVMERILMEYFHAEDITFSTRFSESVLARIHFIIKTNPQDTTEWDFREVERRLMDAGRSWTEELQNFLVESFGEEVANQLYARYKKAFPASYRDSFSARTAVYDIRHIQSVSDENTLAMNFYKTLDESGDSFRLKIYQHDNTIPLSDVLPIIEQLGMRAISERPYALKFDDKKVTWINDFTLQYTRGDGFDVEEFKDLFQNAFASVWFGEAENDGFNQLVLAAGLSWREVSVVRAYARYFKQIGFTFSQDYIESSLNNNPGIAKKLFNLFQIRFNPVENIERSGDFDDQVTQLHNALDGVVNLDEDKIIRQYIHVISASIRTNYYQTDKDGNYKSCISIKFNCKSVPGLPKPHPLYEIFVYSPRVEGVHLRGGKVARGGLRWSDRKEDVRTEVLGLMKAQQVKNAVIVPAGAKGGFVPKRMQVNSSREEVLAEGIACYQTFIRGLLDITDNYHEGNVVKPAQVFCYDEDDPYLVVAADKGTATFSDISNALSEEYGFWLGDAFASGGSVGYDHKKIGITARGAWESVKRHFYELGMDIQNQDFTVVGIGDMAGDVFGNGMLLSKRIKLLAAFNHLHIFIDPDPDSGRSFLERERLFHLPRSNWTDYDKKLISNGGGVFNRNAKSIAVTAEMKKIFNIRQDEIEPNELIRSILKAPVDLLWSAGIGTFVKGKTETSLEVGDRTNDAIRINANQLRCKIVGEGGNLGITQLARMEYALTGGMIYTDFIDNSAGVSCSDKEVNIKILLDTIVAAGDLTKKQRNQLLGEMTEEIAGQVLLDNFAQTRSINLTSAQALRAFELHMRYIGELERSGKIDRALEFLPDDKVLIERKMMGKGLGRPGISVLQSYSKTILKEQILSSNVPEDSCLKGMLTSYFPKPLRETFSKQMQEHPLKREIIATRLSNIIVNEMGFSFVFRMQEETGAPVSAIVRAYIIARSVMGIESVWKQIENLENVISAEKEIELMLSYVRLLRRVTRWFLRNQRLRVNISKSIRLYEPGVIELKKALPQIMSTENREQYDIYFNQYIKDGIPEAFAHELTVARALFSAMDIIEVAQQFELSPVKVAELYFGIGEFLDLTWIRSQIIAHPTENNWESLSREALRDDLDLQQRQLTAGIMSLDSDSKDFLSSFNAWSVSHTNLINRWEHILSELRSNTALNYTMFFVAIRELLDLTQTTVQMSEREAVPV